MARRRRISGIFDGEATQSARGPHGATVRRGVERGCIAGRMQPEFHHGLLRRCGGFPHRAWNIPHPTRPTPFKLPRLQRIPRSARGISVASLLGIPAITPANLEPGEGRCGKTFRALTRRPAGFAPTVRRQETARPRRGPRRLLVPARNTRADRRLQRRRHIDESTLDRYGPSPGNRPRRSPASRDVSGALDRGHDTFKQLSVRRRPDPPDFRHERKPWSARRTSTR